MHSGTLLLGWSEKSPVAPIDGTSGANAERRQGPVRVYKAGVGPKTQEEDVSVQGFRVQVNLQSAGAWRLSPVHASCVSPSKDAWRQTPVLQTSHDAIAPLVCFRLNSTCKPMPALHASGKSFRRPRPHEAGRWGLGGTLRLL